MCVCVCVCVCVCACVLCVCVCVCACVRACCVCVCVCVCVCQELGELTARLVKVLTSSPQQFASLEVKVTETKETLDVGHHDAAFLVLSCVDEKGTSPPPRY